jgi:hypothetical protein
MDEGFELPVNYKGKEILLPARLLTLGYIYKIEVEIHGIIVHFEKDEERNWRAMVIEPSTEFENRIDKDLIVAVIETIEQVMQE